jgi:biopolymer transport protein ExbD
MAAASNDDDDGLISAINVTPLVDVVLVLLIIFMVTARIIHAQGMPMDLPKAASGENVQTVFSVELGADGSTMVDSERLPKDDALSPLALKARTKNPELRAVIRADTKVEHGRVIHVLDLLKRAGIAKIAFAVSPAAAAVPVETPVETEKKP